MSDDERNDAIAERVQELGSGDRETRQQAIRALGETASAAAVEPLISSLRDPEAYLRRVAIGALRGLADPRALAPIIERLNDEDSTTRAAAASALDRFDDERAVTALFEALDDSNPRVGLAASLALGRLGARGVPRLLKMLAQGKHSYHADVAMKAVRSPEAVAPLLAALGDPDRRLRVQAARYLGGFKSDQVVSALRAALQDSDEEVRHFAHGALLVQGVDPEH
ncbi:MAG: HEAT repeat domain-containing protein [Acidobacteriota bacterium]